MTGDNNVSGDWLVFTTDGVDTTLSSDVWNISLDASGVLSAGMERITWEKVSQLVRVPPLQGGSRRFKSVIAHRQ